MKTEEAGVLKEEDEGNTKWGKVKEKSVGQSDP